MNLNFYDLKEEPFGFQPDPRFLYMSATNRQALGSLLIALQSGDGFAMLVAEPGVGKTTLLFHTLHSFADRVATVYLFQPPRTPVDLLRAILKDLSVTAIDHDEDRMFAQLQEALLIAQRLGKRVIVVIDEAQRLDGSVFHFLFTLSNRATTLNGKLIQFVLCGQPSLTEKLTEIDARPSTGSCLVARLEAFSEQETAAYIDYRLQTAGYNRLSPLFTRVAASLVASYSKGAPGTINHLCFEILSTAYQHRRKQIGSDTVHEAATRLNLAERGPGKQAVADSPPAKPVVSKPRPDRVSPLLLPPAFSQPPAEPTFREEYVAGSGSGPAKQPHITVEEPSEDTFPASARAGAPEAEAVSFTMLERAAAEDATNSPGSLALQWVPAAVSRAGYGANALRRLVWRTLPGLGFAAAFLLMVTGAVLARHAARQTNPAFASLRPPEKALSVRSTQPKVTAVASSQERNAVLESGVHDVKGMDLQTALRAIAARKQRLRHLAREPHTHQE